MHIVTDPPKPTEVGDDVGDYRLSSAVFHMVNRLIPEGQVVVTVTPETPAREALALMKAHGYSQLPVIQGGSVLGLFTYRAFALEIAEIDDRAVDAAALPVEEFLEHEVPTYARVSDDFRSLVDVLDDKAAVIVSGPEQLVALLTPMDALRYLCTVANAFVMLEEIERTLRMLIRAALPKDEQFATCLKNALASKYQNSAPPERLEDMTFDEYIALLRDGRNWKLFEPVLGGTRERARGRLEPVRLLRNDVFHFRRQLSEDDERRLAACRNWLLRCVRKMQARSENVQ